MTDKSLDFDWLVWDKNLKHLLVGGSDEGEGGSLYHSHKV